MGSADLLRVSGLPVVPGPHSEILCFVGSMALFSVQPWTYRQSAKSLVWPQHSQGKPCYTERRVTACTFQRAHAINIEKQEKLILRKVNWLLLVFLWGNISWSQSRKAEGPADCASLAKADSLTCNPHSHTQNHSANLLFIWAQIPCFL